MLLRQDILSHLVFMFGLVRLDVALLMRQWWIMLGLK